MEGQSTDPKAQEKAAKCGADVLLRAFYKDFLPRIYQNGIKRALISTTPSYRVPGDKHTLKWTASTVVAKIMGGSAYSEMIGIGEIVTAIPLGTLRRTVFRVGWLDHGPAQPVTATFTASWRHLYNECDLPRPISTVDPEYTLTAIILFVVQTLVFIPRIATRLMGLGKWYKDDTTCIAAYVLLIAQFVLCVLQGVIGCYVHYWDTDYEKIPTFYKINFARAELYSITLAVTKMSVIFFYQRIFEGPKVRRVLWATHFFNISLAIAYFISQCFVSQPLYCEWTFNQGPECTYNDVFDGSGAYSALEAALDLWLVVVAAFLIWKLQMKVTKRLSVIAVFATGFLTFCSALFRFIVWRLSNPANITNGVDALVGLQEVLDNQLTDIMYAMKQLGAWEHIGVGRDDGGSEGEYNPILYRTDVFELVHEETKWLSETPDTPSKSWNSGSTRIITVGVFKHIATGRLILRANTHLDNAVPEARTNQIGVATDIVKAVDATYGPNLPTILTGDFNSGDSDPAYTTLVGEKYLQDMYTTATADQRSERFYTYTGFAGEFSSRIDYIWLGPESGPAGGPITIKKYEVEDNVWGTGRMSDHRPISTRNETMRTAHINYCCAVRKITPGVALDDVVGFYARPAREQAHHVRKTPQPVRPLRQVRPHGLAAMSEGEPGLVRSPEPGHLAIAAQELTLIRLPRHPLVKQLVLGQQARCRGVRDDARPDLLEDVLGYGQPQHAAHVRLSDASMCCQLLEGGLAANRHCFGEAEAGDALDSN
ncbi:hypothetical protein diail_1872, partial [Diaporthe ilicicola]